MKSIKLIINTKSKSYPIYFGNNILGATGNLINSNFKQVKKICIITDNKIPKKLLTKLLISLKNYELKVFRLNVNEKTKNFIVAKNIIEQLLKNNFNRSDCVISFGGGIIGDLSAFIANLTKRGLKFINIPTTLLSQVDASVGGKTGINSNHGKNLIGTFYQPDFIISDILILKSLSEREIISGYGEILKHALILDKKFFLFLLKNGKKIINGKDNKSLIQAIIKSCKIKSEIVKKDEKEKSLRMILNFGHTFAHGFEGAKNFSKKLNHGEAVLLGMMVASELSNKINILSSKELEMIQKHYLNLGLLFNIKKFFKKKEIKKIIFYMKKDKKNVDKNLSLILLKKIGKTKKVIFNSKKVEKFLLSYYN